MLQSLVRVTVSMLLALACSVSLAQGDGTSPQRYGPIKPGETFWGVANGLRGPAPAPSVEQMMVALYFGNPQAFSGGFDGLLKGSVLQVPDFDTIRSVEQADAERYVASVYKRRGIPPSLRFLTATFAAGASAGSVEAEPADQPQPQVPAPGPESKPPATIEPSPVHETSGEGTPAPAHDTASTDAAVASNESPTVADESAVEPDPADSEAGGITPNVESPPAQAEKPEAAQLAPAVAPIETAAINASYGVLQDPLAVGVLAGLAVLVLGAWLRNAGSSRSARRRSGSQDSASAARATASNADFEAELNAALAVSEAEVVAAPGFTPQPELPASEAQPEPVLQSAEPVVFDAPLRPETDLRPTPKPGDPIAEADFHLLYGLQDEAIQGLNEALLVEPHRMDLVVKLAETHFAAGHADAFEQTVARYNGSFSDLDWNRLQDLGRKIKPESQLFGGWIAVPAPSAAGIDDVGDDFGLDLDLSRPSALGEQTFDAGSLDLDPSLDTSADMHDDESPFTEDETGTKLDLARAYLDMGDHEMARSLLSEVFEQGSDAQRAEASQLLQRLPASGPASGA